MEGVAKKGNRSGEDHDERLRACGEGENSQAEHQRPTTVTVTFEGFVDLVGAVMGVRTQQPRDSMTDSGGPPRIAVVVTGVVVRTMVAVDMVVRLGTRCPT